jgi:electron transport complex protein RnfB
MSVEPLPLNPENGTEGPRVVVWIDEDWCIGCTLCIKACPVDAIVGANKRMHTVIENECNGCELCIPACPVDCIHTEVSSGNDTGWAAWSTEQAQRSRTRYESRQHRLRHESAAHQQSKMEALQAKLQDPAAHSQITDPALLERKKSVIEQALARARAKSTHT